MTALCQSSIFGANAGEQWIESVYFIDQIFFAELIFYLF